LPFFDHIAPFWESRFTASRDARPEVQSPTAVPEPSRSETNRIRVLIVSAAQSAVAELRAALNAAAAEAFEIAIAHSAHEAVLQLQSSPSDVVMVDLDSDGSPDLSHLETVTATTADAALIAITASTDDRLAIGTLELGAQDCLVRGSGDLEPDRLTRAIRNAIVRSAHDGSRPLATMFELSTDAIITINRDHVITRFNGAAEQLFGWRAQDALGESVYKLTRDGAREEQYAFVDEIFDGRAQSATSQRRTLRNGRPITVSISGSPILDAFDNVSEACLIIRDLTAEQSGRAAQQMAEEQFARAFDEALIGMAILDTDRRLLRVNRALTRIFGREPQELLGSTLQEYAHEDFRADEAPVMRVLLSGVQRHHVRETCYVHSDGHTIWAEVAISLLTDAEGAADRMVIQVQDITERRAHVESLRHLADHDPLTGLLNRRGFERELESHLARTKRYGSTGALLLLDLDKFKIHNDTFGHDAGDELLSTLAEHLRSRLRTSDVVGRLGGDEFAVLLPDANRARAELVTSSLLDQVRTVTQMLPSAPDAAISASIGMVCFERTGPVELSSAKRFADAAMYEAKRLGRNQYVEWTPSSEFEITPALIAGIKS
jgi:diguanylate cyclase (GGDEF)-like protein/PAS domain S-box-containing protein